MASATRYDSLLKTGNRHNMTHAKNLIAGYVGEYVIRVTQSKASSARSTRSTQRGKSPLRLTHTRFGQRGAASITETVQCFRCGSKKFRYGREIAEPLVFQAGNLGALESWLQRTVPPPAGAILLCHFAVLEYKTLLAAMTNYSRFHWWIFHSSESQAFIRSPVRLLLNAETEAR